MASDLQWCLVAAAHCKVSFWVQLSPQCFGLLAEPVQSATRRLHGAKLQAALEAVPSWLHAALRPGNNALPLWMRLGDRKNVGIEALPHCWVRIQLFSAPLAYSPLQCSQLPILEAAGMAIPQILEQLLGRLARIQLQLQSNLLPDLGKRILSGAPGAWGARLLGPSIHSGSFCGFRRGRPNWS